MKVYVLQADWNNWLGGEDAHEPVSVHISKEDAWDAARRLVERETQDDPEVNGKWTVEEHPEWNEIDASLIHETGDHMEHYSAHIYLCELEAKK